MKSIVTYVGSLAHAFEEEKVMILFGQKAPKELRDISFIHEFQQSYEEITIKEDKFIVDGNQYDIVSIGTEAIKNFAELGHISIYFLEPPKEVLPGSIYVKPYTIPRVEQGTVIEIR